MFEGEVKLEDVEWTKDGIASMGNQMGSSEAGAEETHRIVETPTQLTFRPQTTVLN